MVTYFMCLTCIADDRARSKKEERLTLNLLLLLLLYLNVLFTQRFATDI